MKNVSCRLLSLVAVTLIVSAAALSPALAGITMEIDGDGAGAGDSIVCGNRVYFQITLDNDSDTALTEIHHGFRFYSPDGAASWTYTTVVIEELYDYFGSVDTGWYGLGGALDDTFYLSCTAGAQPGVPNGYDDLILSIRATASCDDTTKTICVDSSYVPPSQPWAWETEDGSFVPSWGGPYCYTIRHERSTVVGTMFEDANADGVHNPGEPDLSGWEACLYQGNTLLQQATTGLSGVYVFYEVDDGDYWVRQTPQAGWTQTCPTQVIHNITVGDARGDRDIGAFGNYYCEASVMTYDTCLAGTKDDFTGPEPTSPHAGLLAVMSLPYGGANPWFDSASTNQGFGHTFDSCWTDTCPVVGATLCLRLKATGSVPTTDGIVLGDWDQEGRIWSIGLGGLNAYAGGDGSWDAGDTMTVCLDLANLPTPSYGPTDILAALQDKTLDIYIQDDTECDWMELSVELCCENPTCYAYGDANGDDWGLQSDDMSYLIGFLLDINPAPESLWTEDLNADCLIDTLDVLMYSAYFGMGMSVFDPYGGYPVATCCDPSVDLCNYPFTMFGLEHTGLGGTLTDTSGGVLKLWRMGLANGDDGVLIDLGESFYPWCCRFQPDSTLDEGVMITTYFDSGSVAGNHYMGLRQTRQGSDNWDLQLLSEAPYYRVRAYLGGEEVFRNDYVTTPGGWFDIGTLGVGRAAGSGGGPYGTSISNLEDAGKVDVGWTTQDTAVWFWPDQGVSGLEVDYVCARPDDPDDEVNVSDLTYLFWFPDDSGTVTILDEQLAIPDTVDIFGLQHVSHGFAHFDTTEEKLAIHRTGDDGVVIDLEEWPLTLNFEFEEDTTLPIGALVGDYLDTSSTASGHYVGTRQKKVAYREWALAVEADVSYYSVTARCGSQTVFSEDSIPASPGWFDLGHFGPGRAAGSGGGPYGTSISNLEDAGIVEIGWWDVDTTFWTWPDQAVFAEPVNWITARPLRESPGEASITQALWRFWHPEDTGVFTIIAEPLLVDFGGIPCTTLGDAWLSVVDDSLLKVAHLDSSGEDGVQMALSLGELHNAGLDYLYSVDPGTMPEGASLELTALGSATLRDDNEIVGTCQAAKNEDLWEISADFSPIGAITHTVQILSGGSVVDEATGHTGPAARAATPPDGLDVMDNPNYYFGARWSTPTEITIVTRHSSRMVSGDELRIMPEAAAGELDSITTLQLRAKDVEEIVITDVRAMVDCCVPPIRGDINMDLNPVIDVSDLVYLVDFMFAGGPPPACFEEADVNATGGELIDIADLVYLVDYMFTGGPDPYPCP